MCRLQITGSGHAPRNRTFHVTSQHRTTTSRGAPAEYMYVSVSVETPSLNVVVGLLLDGWVDGWEGWQLCGHSHHWTHSLAFILTSSLQRTILSDGWSNCSRKKPSRRVDCRHTALRLQCRCVQRGMILAHARHVNSYGVFENTARRFVGSLHVLNAS